MSNRFYYDEVVKNIGLSSQEYTMGSSKTKTIIGVIIAVFLFSLVWMWPIGCILELGNNLMGNLVGMVGGFVFLMLAVVVGVKSGAFTSTNDEE